MYYYRARYYDPETGRFTQPDPLRYRAGMNMYAYVNNNPVNFTDPLGLWPNWRRTYEGTKGVAKGIIEMGGGVAMTQLDTPLPGPADVAGGALALKGFYDASSSRGMLIEGLAGVQDSPLDTTMSGTLSNALANNNKTINDIVNKLDSAITPDLGNNLPSKIKTLKDIIDALEEAEGIIDDVKSKCK